MRKILSFRSQIRKSSRHSWEKRKRYQAQRFSVLLEQARAIPFWKERLKYCHSIDDLDKVPPLTKKELMSNFDNILSPKNISQQSIVDFFETTKDVAAMPSGHFALRTSGTSGQVTYIVIDRDDARRMLASSMVFGTVPNSLPTMMRSFVGKKLRVASIILKSGHFPGTFYSHLMKQFVKLMGLVAKSEIVDIAQPVDDIIDRLNEMNAQVWVSYPSMLRVLVRQSQMGYLKVKPKQIICTSEPLDENTHRLASSEFGSVLHNVYGSGECPFIASTCPNLHLHIRPEVSLLENVDENNKPVPLGETGNQVLVTNLNAYTLPIIRFVLDDRITLTKETCKCHDSAPTLEGIDGRTDDIFWLRDKDNTQFPMHPCAFEPPLISDPRIEEYQITHDADNHITVLIITKDNAIQNEVKSDFSSHLVKLNLDRNLEVNFTFCQEVPRQVSGKFRRFVSKVKRIDKK